jgi:hypothetical protein
LGIKSEKEAEVIYKDFMKESKDILKLIVEESHKKGFDSKILFKINQIL